MKCKGVYHYICENLDADVNSPKCREIKRHLDSCPDCSAYLDSLKKTILLYKRQSGPSVPMQTHRHLHKAIQIAMLETSSDRLRKNESRTRR
jgi:predicted anti-sigma-YlaC factor YlaD